MSHIAEIAQDMLINLESMIHRTIRNGAVETNGRKYQLRFNIRRDAYEELVAMFADRPQFVARPEPPRGYLFGVPLSIVDDPNAPLVALVIEPAEEGASA